MENLIFEYLQATWDITAEMAPWLLLGFLFAGLLHVYVPQQRIKNWLGNSSNASILKAVLIGVPLPLCSCGVIPTAISLYKNGASKSATNAFLISTPQTGVDSIFATYALLGLPFSLIRPIAAFISGILGGVFTRIGLQEKEIPYSTNLKEGQQAPLIQKSFKDVFKYGFGDMVEDLSKWLIIGILLAAAIQVFVPVEALTAITDNPYQEFLVVLALSIPLYVCATGSIPIAVVLMLKGISPGAAFLFLMAGPATNVATFTVLQNTMGNKSTWIYLISILFSAIMFGVIINQFLPYRWFLVSDEVAHTSNHAHWINVISAVFLVGLLLKSIWPISKAEKKIIKKEKDMEFIVNGMTCNHCKANVEKNLSNIEGVSQVNIDLAKGKVIIDGNPDKEQIKNTIHSLGYEYQDA